MQSISDSRVDFITVMGPSSFLSNKSKVCKFDMAEHSSVLHHGCLGCGFELVLCSAETSAWCRPIYGSITVAIMPTAQGVLASACYIAPVPLLTAQFAEGETIQLTLQTNQLLIVPAGWKVATKTKEGR